mmetsp:Transcript_1018/g.1655  ORF Transcript_1018/g.1655 Transcript_1018/m.1655 type:complete len:204 (-) Transcript_1018:504-1115(-)
MRFICATNFGFSELRSDARAGRVVEDFIASSCALRPALNRCSKRITISDFTVSMRSRSDARKFPCASPRVHENESCEYSPAMRSIILQYSSSSSYTNLCSPESPAILSRSDCFVSLALTSLRRRSHLCTNSDIRSSSSSCLLLCESTRRLDSDNSSISISYCVSDCKTTRSSRNVLSGPLADKDSDSASCRDVPSATNALKSC